MHVANKEVRPKEIQKLLAKVDGTPEGDFISRLALRSMKQAKYTPENTGHLDLQRSITAISHHRSEDTRIFRSIGSSKETLRGRMNENRMDIMNPIFTREVTKHASQMERRAEEAERETIRLKKAEYMEQHIGEVFAGVISSIYKMGHVCRTGKYGGRVDTCYQYA